MAKLFQTPLPTSDKSSATLDSDLMGQSNKSAADAGSNQADTSMNDLDGNEFAIHLDEEADDTTVRKDTQDKNASETEKNDGIYPVGCEAFKNPEVMKYAEEYFASMREERECMTAIMRGYTAMNHTLSEVRVLSSVAPTLNRYGVDAQLGEFLLQNVGIPGMHVILPSIESLATSKNYAVARQIATATEGLLKRAADRLKKIVDWILKKIKEFREWISKQTPVIKFTVNNTYNSYCKRDQNEDISLFNGSWATGECYKRDYVCTFAKLVDIEFNKIRDLLNKDDDTTRAEAISACMHTVNSLLDLKTGKFTANTLGQAGFRTMRDLSSDAVYKGVLACVDLPKDCFLDIETRLERMVNDIPRQIEQLQATNYDPSEMDRLQEFVDISSAIQAVVVRCRVRCQQITTWYKNALAKRRV